jgi:methylamine--corrinoid protein Co-methyltransferase
VIGLVRARIWEWCRRAETGKVCPVRKFETEIFYPRVKELVKEYDIRYDAEYIVPTDTTMIDDVYKAALALLLEVGILCIDTERIINFEEWEVKEAIRSVPSEIKVGEGKDSVDIIHRDIEDKRLPTVTGGCPGAPISEEMAVKIYQSYTQEPIIDVLVSGFPETIEGIKVKAGTPSEVHAEICNVSWMREAARRAGRPGMAIMGSMATSPLSDMAATSTEYGWKQTDVRNIWLLPQMKVDYTGLCKLVQFAKYGSVCLWGGGGGYIGGLAGGVEGATLTAVAETIASIVLFGMNFPCVWCYNTLLGTTTDTMGLWGNIMSNAAINRNIRIATLADSPYETAAGPCTEMMLYEIASSVIGTTVAGAHLHGVVGRGGTHTNYFTGLETKFMGEVGHAVAQTRIKLSTANDMVKFLNSKYQEKLEKKTVPIGKKFQECYDTVTITPSREYLDIYIRIKKELENIGLQVE